MANETVGNISAQKSARNALERVQQIEDIVFGAVDKATGERKPGAFESLSKQLDATREQLAGAVEVLDAVVKTLGPETVEKIVIESRVAQARSDAAKQQEQLNGLLASGAMKVTEVVGEQTFVCGTEAKPDGTQIEPGWFLHHMSQIKPAAKEQLMGKAVGFSLTTESGNTYTVTALYEAVPPDQRPKETPAPAPVSDGPRVESANEVFAPAITVS